MKNYTKLFVSIISSSLALGFCASLNHTKEAVVETKAATIDINDYSDCEKAHRSSDEDKASSLLTALRTITSQGTPGSYAKLWDTYKTAYIRDDGKIFDYYSNITNYRPGTDQAGSYSGEGDKYNREHSIPKSWWGGSTSGQGADPFIVVPTDGSVNGKRSNYPMGPVTSPTYESRNGYSKLGPCADGWGYSGTVFEPNDSVKGDFARIVFYAIAKYEDSYTWQKDTEKLGKSTFNNDANKNFGLTDYAVKYCSAWSALDPVSDWERSVNNKIAGIQGNRNPFIDHPEYANTLWGNVSGYTEYPDDDRVLSSISLSDKQTSYEVGDSFVKPTVTAHYEDGSSSDVTSKASFTGYDLETVGNYTVTVSFTKGDVTKTASYSITVSASTKTLESIAVSGQKTEFSVGDTFSFGGTVTATYSNSSQADVTASASFSGYNMNSEGEQEVTVSYTYLGTTRTTTYNIQVSAGSSGGGEAEGYSISNSPLTSAGITNNMLVVWGTSPTHLATGIDSNWVRLSDTSSEWIVFTVEGTSTGFKLKHGTQYVYCSAAKKVEFSNSYTTFMLNNNNLVTNSTSGTFYQNGSDLRPYASGTYTSAYLYALSINKTLTQINISTSPKTSYGVGDNFDPAGLVITRNYSDNTNDTYAYAGHTSEFTFDPDLSTPLTSDDDVVEIGYGGETCLLAITVEGVTSISATPNKTFYVGETITASDITVVDNNDNPVTDFEFSSYQFTYSDAASGGALTNKTFVDGVSIETLHCDLTVQVQRKTYVAPTGGSSLEHTGSEFKTAGISNSYTADQTATVDGIQFKVDGYIYNNTYVSFSPSKYSATGKVINTTPYPAGITNVTVTGASLDVQLSTDGATWVNLSIAQTSTVNYFYLKIYCASTTQDNYVKFTAITVTLKGQENPENVANYIMYEDTNNQCVTKLDVAVGYLANMSSANREEFATSNDYVIKTARTRLEAWAKNQGKVISYATATLSNSSNAYYSAEAPANTTYIIVVIAALSMTSVMVCLIIRKKRMVK